MFFGGSGHLFYGEVNTERYTPILCLLLVLKFCFKGFTGIIPDVESRENYIYIYIYVCLLKTYLPECS